MEPIINAPWFAAGVALFWSLRTVIQRFLFGCEHRRGKWRETAVIWILTVGCGGFTTISLAAEFA